MQRLRLLLILTAALLLAGAETRLSETPAAEAAFPGANGKIAFARASLSGSDIWIVNADGAGEAPLIAGPLIESAPSWSPDGAQLAFIRYDPATNASFLMIANENGSGITQVTTANFDVVSWSPDATKIVFNRGTDLFTVEVESGVVNQLTNDAIGQFHAEWSPLGDRIVYTQLQASDYEIHTIGVNGQNDMKVVGGGTYYPTWSPDGQRIAYRVLVDNDTYEIRDIAATGGVAHKILQVNSTGSVSLAWSPDGQEIAFADHELPTGGGVGIFAADVATGLRRQISSVQGDYHPDWQPLDGQCLGSPASALAPASASTDDDTDGDNIPDNVENNITHTDPNCQDTDGDGLLDPWEVPESTEGAGFDLDGDGDAEVKRDEVFGPYAGDCLDLTGPRFERLGQHCGLVHPPDPLHKDVYVEMDWQDCFEGNCPELVGIAVDPSHHSPDMAGLLDVVNMFHNAPVENPDDVDGVNLHILVDEPIKHIHNCDQAPAATRATNFGTEEQRASAQKIQAKAMAFRYAWSGHSSIKDDTPNECALPSLFVIAQAGAGLGPLPYYDTSPPGNAITGGRDVLVTLAVSWICQLYSFDLPGIVGNLPPCFRKIIGITTGILPGLFPADIALPNGGSQEVPLPMHMLLGIPPSEAVEQLWGRTFARYLGTALGVPSGSLGNDPRTTGSQPVNSYGSWQGLSYAPPSGASPSRLATTGAGEAEPIMPDYTLANQDQDGDGVIERDDNCPALDNPAQSDIDGDGTGDDCDDDPDGDGLVGGADAEPGDTDNDGTPNDTDTDDDADGVADGDDNCPVAANPAQADADTDGAGDPCDGDRDGDGLPDFFEAVVGTDPDDPAGTPEFVGNGDSCSDGEDNDGDGDTDTADDGCLDPDGDTVPSSIDNCPALATNNLQDSDGDGTGDPCEPPGKTRTWGDNNCSGSADPVDALLALRFDAGQSTNTGECPDLGATITAGGTPRLWGDVDCSGDVGPIDGLKLLRFDSGLSVAQEPGCPEMGGPVSVAVAALPGAQPVTVARRIKREH